MVPYSTLIAAVLLGAAVASPARQLDARGDAPAPCDTTLCVDGVSDCGEPFGGCFPYCEGDPFPTFSTSPCPTTTPALVPRAQQPTQTFTESNLETFPTIINDVDPCPTICVDKVNECGLRYGGCAPRCEGQPLPSFSKPPCPSTTKKASCSTNTAPATIACDPILKPGQFGVPYQYTYPLPTTSCPGKPPKSTPKRDYQDCPKTTPAPSAPKTTACKTSTVTASVMCDPILQPGEFGVPTQSPYPLPITSCPGKAPSSTPKQDYVDCPKTTSKAACETIVVDGRKDCTSTTIGFGGPVTRCPGKPASSTWTSPVCPTKTGH